jgi:hypothetical protein
MLRSLMVGLLCVFAFAVSDSPAWARSPRVKHAAQAAPPAPPFPWIAVLETVGPLVGVWFGTVLLRRTVEREHAPTPAPSEIASFPVAWFAAMSGLFERKRRDLPFGPAREGMPLGEPSVSARQEPRPPQSLISDT